MLFERRCPGCGERSAGLCPPCRLAVVPAPPLPAVAGLASLQAWSRYEGTGRAAVLALKHGGRRDLARWLAAEVAPLAPHAALVTWIPASRSGRRHRGYDQGQLLARAVGRRLGRPVVPLLRRPVRTGSQRGRGRDERLTGVAFTARRAVAGAVLLIDDVATTGASLAHAAHALRRAGAPVVHGLVVATAGRDLRPRVGPGPDPHIGGAEATDRHRNGPGWQPAWSRTTSRSTPAEPERHLAGRGRGDHGAPHSGGRPPRPPAALRGSDGPPPSHH